MSAKPEWMRFLANGTVCAYDADAFKKGGYEVYDPTAKAPEAAPEAPKARKPKPAAEQPA